MIDYSISIQRVQQYFETISPQTALEVERVYAADARFKDPFNDVVGTACISRIYQHMFVQVCNPRFIVKRSILQGEHGVLMWDFMFSFKPGQETVTVEGCSHLTFNQAGLITQHIDYWDVAEQLYEKIPVLGSFMRWLKKRNRVV